MLLWNNYIKFGKLYFKFIVLYTVYTVNVIRHIIQELTVQMNAVCLYHVHDKGSHQLVLFLLSNAIKMDQVFYDVMTQYRSYGLFIPFTTWVIYMSQILA